MPQVNKRKHLWRRCHDLKRLAVARHENGAQNFVTANDLADGLLEGRDIQWATNMQRGVHVVDGAVRLQLMKEPKTLLCERKRQRHFARDRRHRRNAVVSRNHRRDLLREFSYRRPFEEFA